jgi:hypothetical protein
MEKQPNISVEERPNGEEEGVVDRSSRASTIMPESYTGWDDWWLWELLGIVMSAAAIAAIIGLLIDMDGKKVPNWGFTMKSRTVGGKFIPEKTVNISLNSVISWISTVGKICILIPITKGIGQLKWVWFSEQERQLSDFEKFENATRGLTGSVMLLWKLRGR